MKVVNLALIWTVDRLEPVMARQTPMFRPRDQQAAAQTEAPRRRNIVGRMDLRRVTTPPGAAGGAGRPRACDRSPQYPHGFLLAEPQTSAPAPIVEDAFQRRERELREEKRPGAAGAAGGREEVPQVFTATEFRKREVIFQPKKKNL